MLKITLDESMCLQVSDVLFYEVCIFDPMPKAKESFYPSVRNVCGN